MWSTYMMEYYSVVKRNEGDGWVEVEEGIRGINSNGEKSNKNKF